MAGRNPLRFLAPIALAACAFALYTVVNDARSVGRDSSSQTPAKSGTPAGSQTGSSSKKTKRRRKVYTVKSGDTASGISVKTGVSLATMRKLNKHFDPQTLAPGQRIRLSG
jgi:LysM repeat protein